MTPRVRLFAAAVCLAAWLVLLFFGFALGGAVHLLAVAGFALVPWRAAGAPAASDES
jgi:F0F1-type ATP synthase assembly protein I